jgi:hypothetical protein
VVRYDGHITIKKLKHPSSETSDIYQDFFAISGSDRAARLAVSPPLPRPLDASLGQDGCITWTWYGTDRGARRRPPAIKQPPPTFCFAFAKLADSSPEQVRGFAAKWGPLGAEGPEPVERWLEHARRARAYLRFFGELLSRGPGKDEDWKIICESLSIQLVRSDFNRAAQMAVTASAVNKWFAEARGHRLLDIVNHTLVVRPGASNLLGVLITQVAQVIARSDQLAVCAGCWDPFTPTRPLSKGLRQYCKKCRKRKIPARDAARDWRRRRRTKESANSPGESK